MSESPRQRQSLVQLGAILGGSAVMQLVPGVSDYLLMAWMPVGLGGAVFLSLMLLEDRAQLRLDPLARLHWILLVVYLVHQFEEHGVDLLGRPYFFIAYVKSVLGDFGAASGFSLTPLAIYRTNTLFVWLPFLVAVWGHRRFIWPGLAAAGLVLTNAIVHIGMAIWRAEYNPGVGTAIVLFLPVGMLYFRFVRRYCGVGWAGIAGGVLFGAAEHSLLFLRIRFNLAPSMPPVALGIIAFAPLIANVLSEGRGLVRLLRHALAIALLPLTVTVFVPVWIARRYAVALPPGTSVASLGLEVIAVGLLATGIALFLSSLRRFDTEGHGTLAPWDPPRQLVVRGPYRYVRNPMISGVIFVLFGESLLLLSFPLAIWATFFLGLNLAYIPLVEEPQLRRRFGDSYAEYCRYVPRFLPRLRPWAPSEE